MENLRKLRTQHNLSQQKLADILHVSQQSIYKYENDITTPDLNTLKTMADFFNTSIDYLIDYSDIAHKIEKTSDYSLNDLEILEITEFRKLPSSVKSLIISYMQEYNNKTP